MLTKGRINFIQSLKDKKIRTKAGAFVVEGEKSALELLESDFSILEAYATRRFVNKHKDILNKNRVRAVIIEEGELKKISQFETASEVVIIVKQKPNVPFKKIGEKIIALDDVRDPGNLGTLIRIADWYGISQIVCSKTCTDLWNSKVISASMGSFTRVQVFYTDLLTFFDNAKLPVLGTCLEGEHVNTFHFPEKGILLLGNEANGISPEIKKEVMQKITIPRPGKAESLNVSVAGAIILDRWINS